MSKRSLAVFCRAPLVGRCKTRLIGTLGAEGACQAHIQLARDTLARVASHAGQVTLWTTESDQQIDAWARQYGYTVAIQQGTDLGERMSHALNTSLEQGAEQVCLIGVDCPLIDADYIALAFRGLNDTDLVLGPAEDGGYGLIGVARHHPDLFVDIVWGSDQVLQQTLKAAAGLDLRTCLLPTIWDVDDAADWQRYQSFIRT